MNKKGIGPLVIPLLLIGVLLFIVFPAASVGVIFNKLSDNPILLILILFFILFVIIRNKKK